MFYEIAVALNNPPLSHSSLHTSIDTLLASEPHADFSNATASSLEAIPNHSRTEADSKRTAGRMRNVAAHVNDRAPVTFGNL
jgi:hypothetical protein